MPGPGAVLSFSLLERPEFQCGEELGALQNFSITQEPGHMLRVHFFCLSFRAQRAPRAKRVTDHYILFSVACGHTSPNHPPSPHGFSRSSCLLKEGIRLLHVWVLGNGTVPSTSLQAWPFSPTLVERKGRLKSGGDWKFRRVSTWFPVCGISLTNAHELPEQTRNSSGLCGGHCGQQMKGKV